MLNSHYIPSSTLRLLKIYILAFLVYPIMIFCIFIYFLWCGACFTMQSDGPTRRHPIILYFALRS